MEKSALQQLLEYNKAGLIPGPDESEEAFFQRAEYCLNLNDRLAEHLGDAFPFLEEGRSSEEALEQSFEITRTFYGIEPRWVPLFFNNYKLSPWHGGCAWIFQLNESSPTTALLQLRKKYGERAQDSGFYSRNEILAHESAHIGRMLFEEPCFEEILAYRSSSSTFRRRFGPIAQSSIETGLFVLILFIIILLDLFFIVFGYETAYFQAAWIKLIPLAMLGYGVYRSSKRHAQFKRCLQHLNALLNNKITANAVAYRLTDEEIIAFSQCSPEEIENYAKENKEKSLRWKLISAAYLEFQNKENYTDRYIQNMIKKS